MPKSVKFKFLIDENLHIDVASFLKKSGHDVILVPKGVKNGSVFRLAVQKRRVLLTGDRDFINESLYPPRKTKGIVVAKIHPPAPSLIIPILKTLLHSASPKRISGKLVLLEPDAVRIE